MEAEPSIRAERKDLKSEKLHCGSWSGCRVTMAINSISSQYVGCWLIFLHNNIWLGSRRLKLEYQERGGNERCDCVSEVQKKKKGKKHTRANTHERTLGRFLC